MTHTRQSRVVALLVAGVLVAIGGATARALHEAGAAGAAAAVPAHAASPAPDPAKGLGGAVAPAAPDAGPASGPAGGSRSAPPDRVLRGEQSFPDGFTVPAGQVWEFAPQTTTTVSVSANVVVEGVLRMRPAGPDVAHALRFVDVDESQFQGGQHAGHNGSDVLATDVGLWVVGDGQLDIEGTRRVGWNRTGTDPTWRPGDEIRTAPHAAGDSSTFARFEPGSPVPTVSYGGKSYATEVLNLTRNVRIEGTGDGRAHPRGNGRAHIWIHSSQPQSIRYAELRHLGPRQVSSGDNPTEGVFGRYPLHFHMAEDGSRDSIVEGVVVRNSGHRAFVPHKSHGITFRDTIAFDVFDSAYWWDGDHRGHGIASAHATNDLVWDRAMAALVRFDPDFRGYGTHGFVLEEGVNLTVTDSVAVGIQGNVSSAGFHWPSNTNGNQNNKWNFTGNVAHNNRTSGIRVWHNDNNDHVISGFVAYRNGKFGIDHGAYGNRYRYEDVVSFQNGEAGIHSTAGSAGRLQQVWHNVDTDSILLGHHQLSASTPVLFDGLTLRGKIVVDEERNSIAYEFRNARTTSGPLSRSDFEVRRQLSTITVVGGNGSTFQL